MIETRVRCNDCSSKSCQSYKSVKASKRCRMFIPCENLKTPMLVHLMSGRKAINTTKVLQRFGFKIEEIGTYPYFRLYTK